MKCYMKHHQFIFQQMQRAFYIALCANYTFLKRFQYMKVFNTWTTDTCLKKKVSKAKHMLTNRRIWTELPHTAHPMNLQYYLCCFTKGFQNIFPFSFSPICASHVLSISSVFERKGQDYNKRLVNSQISNSNFPTELKYLYAAYNNLSLSIS